MSPTIFREGGFRFYFFSREETRMHVHVQGAEGEAKFWIEPNIELARNEGIPDRQIGRIEKLVRKHEDEIRHAWKTRFRD